MFDNDGYRMWGEVNTPCFVVLMGSQAYRVGDHIIQHIGGCGITFCPNGGNVSPFDMVGQVGKQLPVIR